MVKQRNFFQLTILLLVFLLVPNSFAQERRAKLRISNAGFTITALPKIGDYSPPMDWIWRSS